MEVKPGYKQTEVGVIPEEWEVARVAELVTNGPKNGYSGRSGKEARGTPTLSLGATSSGSMVLNEETVKCLDESIPKNADLYLKPGDVLVQRSNTQDLVGTTAVFDGPAGVYVYPDLMMRMRFRDDATAHFFWRYANSTSGRRFFVRIAAGSSGSMPKISGEKLRKMPLPLPPLPEQRAIAEALSDVDGLLGGLDRLISKKRDLKQAAMQQLLTGQTRLPGFHDEWEVKRLGDAFTITAGRSKSAYVVEDGDFWVCDMGSVSVEGRLIVSKRTNYRGDFLKRGDLIMPKDDIGGGNIIGKVGYIDANDTYVLGDHVYCLRALKGDPRFLAYVINSYRVNSELRKKVIGSAQLGLGRKSVIEQEIAFPSHAEQTAIAEVLSEMDGELGKLEERREKTRALKQAMMQELLTGRTRLV